MACRRLLVLLLLGLLGCSDDGPEPPTTPDPERPRPNVVLILVDDLRFDSLGFAGHPFFQSPSMDRLAAEGTVFEDAFVITSLCTSSRATMLTGKYTHEHGVRDIRTPLGVSEVIVPQLLQESGYETAWIGKWHLNADGTPDRGFDHWVSFRAHGHYIDPEVNVDGNWTVFEGHMTDVLTDHAIDFLQRSRDEPFFLALSHPAVHQPYEPQARFAGAYATVEVSLPSTWNDPQPGQPSYLACREDLQSDSELEAMIRDYFDLLAGVDESVGRVVEELETQGVLDDTLILLISDNGYMHGEHGLLDKRSAYEPSMRVPLIVRYPSLFAAGARVRDNLALNLDVPSTILNAARLEIPETMHGFPLDLLASGARTREQFLYSYFLDAAAQGTPEMRALRTLDAKYVVYPGSQETEELYDLDADPDERTNLARDPDSSALLEDMKTKLSAERSRLGDDDSVAREITAEGEWVARVFLEVRDASTGEPLEGAVVTCYEPTAELCPGEFTTFANGRWFHCTKTSTTALHFRVQSVTVPGYAPAGPFATVVLDPDDPEYFDRIRMRSLQTLR